MGNKAVKREYQVLRYFVRTQDARLHLDTDGLLTSPLETSPMWFDSADDAARHDCFTGHAELSLVVDAVPTGETKPGLPYGAIDADEVISNLSRLRQMFGVEATE
jgi:hypothetical protein